VLLCAQSITQSTAYTATIRLLQCVVDCRDGRESECQYKSQLGSWKPVVMDRISGTRRSASTRQNVGVDLACQVCSNRNNAEQMLLCDSCDEGYHMLCLDPPLSKVSNMNATLHAQAYARKRSHAPATNMLSHIHLFQLPGAEDNWHCPKCLTPCRHCRKKDTTDLLLCANCSESWHMQCLSTPLAKVSRLPTCTNMYTRTRTFVCACTWTRTHTLTHTSRACTAAPWRLAMRSLYVQHRHRWRERGQR
jgi:hypothetical protein